MKKWTYAIGIIALGFVVFNNMVQTSQIIKSNINYAWGLGIALIGTLFYGIVNIK